MSPGSGRLVEAGRLGGNGGVLGVQRLAEEERRGGQVAQGTTHVAYPIPLHTQPSLACRQAAMHHVHACARTCRRLQTGVDEGDITP